MKTPLALLITQRSQARSWERAALHLRRQLKRTRLALHHAESVDRDFLCAVAQEDGCLDPAIECVDAGDRGRDAADPYAADATCHSQLLAPRGRRRPSRC